MRRASREGRSTVGSVPRRVGARRRQAALARVHRAAAEGRFGGSDEYERRAERVASARTEDDLSDVTSDLTRLVTRRERERLLAALARAHAAEELDYAEFLERSDRASEPLHHDEADELVADVGGGWRLRRASWRARGREVWRAPWWRCRARRLGVPALAGGLVGGVAVALPVLVALPSQFGAWLPVVLLTGAFSAAGSVATTSALRWRLRAGPGPSRHPSRLSRGRDPASGSGRGGG